MTPVADTDLTILPEAHSLARNMVKAKGRTLRGAPSTADLATAITDVQMNGTMQGIPSLELTILDPRWTFLDSGFFDTDENSEIDPIDLNFPTGSRYWWRCTQVSPSGSDRTIKLTFLVREAVYLMHVHYKGGKKANRARMTRAEFMASCVADAEGKVEFYSIQLDVKQPIGKIDNAPTSSSKKKKGKGAKTAGVGKNAKGLTCKGSPLTSGQLDVINAALFECDKLSAPDNARIALIYAGMGESSLGKDAGEANNVWQANHPSSYTNVGEMAAAFLQGKKDFQNGGAIVNANSGHSIWVIANEVEANNAWNTTHTDSYAHQWAGSGTDGITEAKAIVAAGGGSGGITNSVTTSGTTIEAYFYEVHPGEDLWSALVRLAGEVNWELFWDGNRLYYDSEQTLIRQKPAAKIDRDEGIVANWDYDWDVRQICTQMSLELFDRVFDLMPGEVLELTGFGPASTGSSVKLPGRWLIRDAVRAGGDLSTKYVLVQPDKPTAEPAPQIKTWTKTTTTTGKGGAAAFIPGTIQDQSAGTPEAAYVAAQYLSNLKLIYTQQVRTLVRNASQYAGKHYLDCSASVSWVLLAAGFEIPNAATWGSWAPVSGDFFAGACNGKLVSGPGESMTIYANAEHVFIRIHPSGASDMQGNTVNPFGSGFGFYPWSKGWPGAGCGPSPHAGFWQVHYDGT